MDALAAGHDAAVQMIDTSIGNVGVSRSDMTNSPRTIWLSSNSHQSGFGSVLMKVDALAPPALALARHGVGRERHDHAYRLLRRWSLIGDTLGALTGNSGCRLEESRYKGDHSTDRRDRAEQE